MPVTVRPAAMVYRPCSKWRIRADIGRSYDKRLYCNSCYDFEKRIPFPCLRVVAWLSSNALVSINLVTLRRARLIGWLTVCGRAAISVYNQPPRSTQPPIPPGRLIVYRLFWLGLVRRGAFTCVRWQVTLCDLIWQVISRSFEVCTCTRRAISLTCNLKFMSLDVIEISPKMSLRHFAIDSN